MIKKEEDSLIEKIKDLHKNIEQNEVRQSQLKSDLEQAESRQKRFMKDLDQSMSKLKDVWGKILKNYRDNFNGKGSEG